MPDYPGNRSGPDKPEVMANRNQRRDRYMPKIIAALAEVAVFILVMWVLTFLPTFLHELGHALGYMLSTGGRHWHIRVGFGKKLLETKPLTVNLLIF